MSEDAPVELPAEIMPISWLIGSWVGVGLGTYPGIEDFQFGQEVVFSCDGDHFLPMYLVVGSSTPRANA